MTDEELMEEMIKRAEAYQERIKRDFAIEELKKLKNEMNNYCDLHGIYDWGLIDLVIERIKQLKVDKE